jgi:hypothetical protein
MKLIKYVHRTVVHDDFSVSCHTGSNIKGAILHVRRHRIGGRELNWKQTMSGLGNERLFPSTDAAWQFAFDHGYTKLYFTHSDLRTKRLAAGKNYPYKGKTGDENHEIQSY